MDILTPFLARYERERKELEERMEQLANRIVELEHQGTSKPEEPAQKTKKAG